MNELIGALSENTMAKMKPKLDDQPEPTTDWQAKAEDYLASWQRTQADLENFRRRVDQQLTDVKNMAAADAYLRLTPILDDFPRAFAHLPVTEEHSPWVIGMQQVEKHLRTTLANAGLTPIEETGVFNPLRHEAIAYEAHPDQPDGTIIDVIEVGWQMGDRIIKPARVRVSKGK